MTCFAVSTMFCSPSHHFPFKSDLSQWIPHTLQLAEIEITDYLASNEYDPTTDHVARLHIVEGRLWSAFWIRAPAGIDLWGSFFWGSSNW
jgi:hypothetical protein